MLSTKLFQAALAPLAFAAALSIGEAAYAQATPYNVFAYAVGGPRTDPCAILYAIAPVGAPRYTAANGYILVRSAPNRSTAQQFLALFSKYSDNKPDGVVKLVPCASGATPKKPGGPGGLACNPTMNNKYRGLTAKLHVPGDTGRYGSCKDYGWWSGTSYKGQNVRPGYWVYVAPYWYIYSGRN